jgi:hypothetical protein
MLLQSRRTYVPKSLAGVPDFSWYKIPNREMQNDPKMY